MLIGCCVFKGLVVVILTMLIGCCVLRVYLDGDYVEPDHSMLPPSPMVEEVNDCRCSVM